MINIFVHFEKKNIDVYLQDFVSFKEMFEDKNTMNIDGVKGKRGIMWKK